MTGALQGYNKDTAWKELGLDQELVMQMRRSYDVRPPRMEDDHIHWHGNDRRYKKLTPEKLEASRAESLKDTADRIMPFFESVIKPAMQGGNKCLIVSHANTIRTLVKHIDNISDEDIKGMTIPTGIPLLYRLNKDMKPVDPQMDLEFRYLVQPKGYVGESLLGCADGEMDELTNSSSSTATPGALHGHMAFTAYTSEMWSVYRIFRKSVTPQIVVGSELFCAILAKQSAGTWIQSKRVPLGVMRLR